MLILMALSERSARAEIAFFSSATSGMATTDPRQGSTRAAAAAWWTGQSLQGCSFQVPRSAARVPVGRDTLVRVRVRAVPTREEPTIASLAGRGWWWWWWPAAASPSLSEPPPP